MKSTLRHDANRLLSLCAWCILLICSVPALAMSETLLPGLKASPRAWYCGPHVHDDSPAYAWQQLAELDWQPTPDGTLNKGFTTEECWLRRTVTNVSDAPLQVVVATGYALLDRAVMYAFDPPSGTLQLQQQSGTLVPFTDWPVPNQNPAFLFEIPPGAQWLLVWRARSAFSLQLDTRFSFEHDFYAKQETLLAIHSLFFGAMLVMIAYNLFVYLAIWEKMYLQYVFWALSMTLFQVFYWGIGQRFMWSEAAGWTFGGMSLLLPCIVMLGTAFARSFLQLDTVSPKDALPLKLLGWAAGLQVVAWWFVDIYYLVPVSTVTIILMVILIPIASLRRMQAGDRSALYFGLAWLCLVLGVLFMALNKLGLLPVTPTTENLVEVGTLVEAVLLSLALAQRISTLKASSQLAELEASKAVELSRSKSDFLAAMSHEIRTPMNGVLGMADLLRHSRLPPEQAGYVETIYQSTNSLLRVINDILDYSRIEAGKIELDPVPTDVPALVDECGQLFSLQSRSKGVPLQIEIDDAVPTWLLLDPVRVKQVLNNLLSNAFKFTEQGQVRVRVTAHEPAEPDALPTLRIEVADTGIGMSEEQQARLFQDYAQADRSIVRRFGGTGLGLVICKKLAERMDGGISLSSQAGAGAQFTVWLPLVRSPRMARQTAAPVSSDCLLGAASRMRLLVAEDNPTNQVVIRHMLNKLGLRFELVKNGEQALQRVASGEFPPDIILMDCNMPELDGYEATQRIRALALPCQPWIIGLSANAAEADIQKALAMGMDSYLTKPITLERLQEGIEEAQRARLQEG